jgi:[ribosomal protein S5]-alanine N-acetyltransferase
LKEQSILVQPTTPKEFEIILNYFFDANTAFLKGMGVDPQKLPVREQWRKDFLANTKKADPDKDRFYVTWIYNEQPVGHSNINKIIYGREAFIHLHLWPSTLRKAGLGTQFFRLSAEFFAKRFHLQKIICEPYAENPAPNKTLPKVGFHFIKRYKTIPGPINFEQEVNRYELTL